MGAQHIIELNGKRYDTATGKLIENAKPAKRTASTAPRTKPDNVDGVRRIRKSSAAPNHTARRPQKSQTLMREPAQTATLKSKTAESAAAPAQVIESWPHTTILDTKRLKRAQTIPQNRFIGRFSAKATPKAPDITPAAVPVVTASVIPPTPPPQTTTTAANPLEAAVNRATSHRQPKQTKPRGHHRIARKLHVKPRTVGVLSGVLIAGALAGFTLYQNLPKAHMKLASSRAGISGVLPSYIPSGYKLGNDIDYKQGEITLNFHSNSDQRNFAVTQSQSYWTSQALKQNYIEPLDAAYQTVQENGKTIYLYEDGATWVDGGVWYKVEDKDAQLSSAQLTNLIKSL